MGGQQENYKIEQIEIEKIWIEIGKKGVIFIDK